jgi:linoleoyl-CoA desaturase
MVIKTIVVMSMFILPLVYITLGLTDSAVLFVLLYVLSGIGMAFVGMAVMHDAIHGAYSNRKWVNTLLGKSINLIGSNQNIWHFQHNVLHHSYTNIHDADDDIITVPWMRFSPHGELRKVHKYQHYFAWIFYGLVTLSWVTLKDFFSLAKFRRLGLITSKKQFYFMLADIIIWKLVYFSFAFVLPLMFSGFPLGIVLIGFMAKHFVTGVILSFVFQSAHVIPQTEYPLPNNEGEIAHERLVHQLLTTANFSPNNKVFSWFIGGLNFQIEHHLYPNVCHVHYRELSKIVQKTAIEYNLPYMSKKNFLVAIRDHLLMLKQLGRRPAVTAQLVERP